MRSLRYGDLGLRAGETVLLAGGVTAGLGHELEEFSEGGCSVRRDVLLRDPGHGDRCGKREEQRQHEDRIGEVAATRRLGPMLPAPPELELDKSVDAYKQKAAAKLDEQKAAIDSAKAKLGGLAGDARLADLCLR